jgi:hypothetical protein
MERPQAFREQAVASAIDETADGTTAVAPTCDDSGDVVLQKLICRIAQQDQKALTELYRGKRVPHTHGLGCRASVKMCSS